MDVRAELGAGPQPREGADRWRGRRPRAPASGRRPGSATPSPTVTPGPKTTKGPTTLSRPIFVSALRNTVSGATKVTPSSIARRAQAALHRGFGGGELGAAVDAQQFVGRRLDRAQARPRLRATRDDVGQIIFALGIARCRSRRAARRDAAPSIAITPELHRPIARCSALASAASTIASSAPSAAETSRP